MAIVSFTDEDGVHSTDEFSKTYEKHLKAQALKRVAAVKVEPAKLVKLDVKPEPKSL
ncbi:hypothetical protein [Rhodococcus sp. ARC_M6]|uniref:hypothetical protein n=1 Tax=Rhodococcus sp. ARC_M6 TaxID=2928852 RepID=UPI001FB23E4F|nr:hypothetical protein [Rhodococcus sp. ARC_M6]MCJ0906231.1 hypothetical protein [Rhodococcus sp. ARC_M6]